VTDALLDTAVCSRLGIALPILGAPMGRVAGPDLAAAVSNAGGLGILGHANVELAAMREELRRTKALTNAPFGVGLLFPSGRAVRPRIEELGDASPRELPEWLSHLRSMVPEPADPAPTPAQFDVELAMARLDIAVDEGVEVLACGLGTPPEVVQLAHSAGMAVISLVGSRRAALEVQDAGADIIVAQGHEAGGHTGRVTTFVLVPQVVDAVHVPVVAAGGVVDGRGVAAALALGAAGVLIGTRLLATPEAATAEVHKRRVVSMADDETVVSSCYTGKPSRVLRNAFTDAWRGHEAEIRQMPDQWEMVESLVRPAKAAGSLEVANWPTGQGAVLIQRMDSAEAVVRDMADQGRRILQRVGHLAGPPEHPTQRHAAGRE
jgi:NAD(P)H-dependent flavin oxidoreductase YrpB (nitropropane dioxygenase family)